MRPHILLALLLGACGGADTPPPDAALDGGEDGLDAEPPPRDASAADGAPSMDASAVDAAVLDAGSELDAPLVDAPALPDAPSSDGGSPADGWAPMGSCLGDCSDTPRSRRAGECFGAGEAADFDYVRSIAITNGTTCPPGSSIIGFLMYADGSCIRTGTYFCG
jgi:hypothetical protein